MLILAGIELVERPLIWRLPHSQRNLGKRHHMKATKASKNDKLSFAKETVRNLTVKTSVRAGNATQCKARSNIITGSKQQ
jgi:hypothetical protein